MYAIKKRTQCAYRCKHAQMTCGAPFTSSAVKEQCLFPDACKFLLSNISVTTRPYSRKPSPLDANKLKCTAPHCKSLQCSHHGEGEYRFLLKVVRLPTVVRVPFKACLAEKEQHTGVRVVRHDYAKEQS